MQLTSLTLLYVLSCKYNWQFTSQTIMPFRYTKHHHIPSFASSIAYIDSCSTQISYCPFSFLQYSRWNTVCCYCILLVLELLNLSPLTVLNYTQHSYQFKYIICILYTIHSIIVKFQVDGYSLTDCFLNPNIH